MATYSTRIRPRGISIPLLRGLLPQVQVRRGTLFGALILMALIAFEAFNYSTTEFALADLVGDLSFASIRWATILALAFCGMDFAGIARLFTPEKTKATEAWYLLGAWFLAATMNAILTWWAISIALLDHQTLGNEIVSRETLLSSVPVFVAILVWLIRVLMIGSFTLNSGKRSADNLHNPSHAEVAPVVDGRSANGKSSPIQPRNRRFSPKPKHS
jgi:hypothetical protein